MFTRSFLDTQTLLLCKYSCTYQYFYARFNHMKGQWYNIGRHGYHSASPVTWLQKTIRTAEGL